MNDDLNTAVAINVLSKFADEIVTSAGAGLNVEDAQYLLRRRCGILGLRLDHQQPESQVIAGWQEHRRRFAS
jgi:cystathionine beta-lyase/cystathionine gamma-synthase